MVFHNRFNEHSMQTPFTSPYATRKLSIAIAWAVVTLAWGILWMWPYDTPEGPGVFAKICVLIVFSSIFLWAGYKSWKAWLVDYEYGVRLSKLVQASEVVDKDATGIQSLNHESLTDSLAQVDKPAKEKLRFPLPSLVCCILLVVYIFQWQPVSTLWLGAIVCFLLFVYRPFHRWTLCYSETQSFEAVSYTHLTLPTILRV